MTSICSSVAMPSHRFMLSLTASLALHAAVFILADVWQLIPVSVSKTQTILEAHLLPHIDKEAATSEPVLKNTLDKHESRAKPFAPTTAQVSQSSSRPERLTAAKAAQHKLAEHLLYPPEAIARGLEGEVRLLLKLDSQGKVLSAEIASSSDHAILDQAAIDAAYAMRRLAGTGTKEMILPVVFRLQ